MDDMLMDQFLIMIEELRALCRSGNYNEVKSHLMKMYEKLDHESLDMFYSALLSLKRQDEAMLVLAASAIIDPDNIIMNLPRFCGHPRESGERGNPFFEKQMPRLRSA